MRRTSKRLIIWSLMLSAMPPPAVAHQSQPPEAGNIVQSSHPSVKSGRLANGITYRILPTNHPGDPLQLQLVIRAGKAHGSKGEEEFAHLVEHLAMNPGGEVSSALLRHGITRDSSPDGVKVWNGSTGQIETIYQLQLPAGREDLLPVGIAILRMWAGPAKLDDETVNATRAIVSRELAGVETDDRLWKSMASELLASPYYPPDPIGESERSVANANLDGLRSFYNKHYVSDLMGIVVVGKFDAKESEDLIRSSFSELRSSEQKSLPPIDPRSLKVNLDGKNRFVWKTGTLASRAEIRIMSMNARGDINSDLAQDVKQTVLDGIINILVKNRLNEIRQASTSPVTDTWDYTAGDENPLFGAETRLTSATLVMRPQSAESYKVELLQALRFIRQINEHGFFPSEVEKAKAQYLSSSGTTNRQIADDLAKSIANDKPYVSRDIEEKGRRKFVSEIGPEEIRLRLSSYWHPEHDLYVAAMLPRSFSDGAGLDVDFHKAVRRVGKFPIGLYIPEPSPPGSLVSKAVVDSLNIAPVVQVGDISEIGAAQFKLANGVSVIVRPEARPDGRVIVTGFRRGGYAAYEDDDQLAARLSGEFATYSGAMAFDPTTVARYFRSQGIGFSAAITSEAALVTANGKAADLDRVLQAIFAYQTAPNLRRSAFKDWRNGQILSAKAVVDADPLADAMRARRFPEATELNQSLESLKEIRSLSHRKLSRIFRDRFVNAGDFTYVISGHVSLEDAKKLAARYLGNLSPSRSKASYIVNDVQLPALGSSIDVVSVKKSNEDKVNILVEGRFNGGIEDQIIIELLASVLNQRIIERVRYKEGGSYAPSARSIFIGPRRSDGVWSYTFSVNFSCDKSDVEKLRKAALEEVVHLSLGDVSQKEVDAGMSQLRLSPQFSTSIVDTWTSVIRNHVLFGDDITRPITRERLLKSDVDLEIIKRKARTFFEGGFTRIFISRSIGE